MATPRAAALARLSRAYQATEALQVAVDALDDPQALAYVDIAISVLTRLYKHLEAQAQETGGREP